MGFINGSFLRKLLVPQTNRPWTNYTRKRLVQCEEATCHGLSETRNGRQYCQWEYFCIGWFPKRRRSRSPWLCAPELWTVLMPINPNLSVLESVIYLVIRGNGINHTQMANGFNARAALSSCVPRLATNRKHIRDFKILCTIPDFFPYVCDPRWSSSHGGKLRRYCWMMVRPEGNPTFIDDCTRSDHPP